LDFLNNDEMLAALRSSVTSYRIFKKYGWNKVDSGWTSFF
jgi:hypothetical protein